MRNKRIKQMMADVAKTEIIEVSGNLSDSEAIVWDKGPCYICGGNFIWLSEGLVSLTGDELRGSDYE